MKRSSLTVLLLSCLVVVAFCARGVLAADEPLFESTIRSTYHFSAYTYASVEHDISIHGLQDDYYPSSYTMLLENARVIDARVVANDRPLEFDFDSQRLSVKFASLEEYQASQLFKILYKVEDIVKKQGVLHEVVIPIVQPDAKSLVSQQWFEIYVPKSWRQIQSSSIPVDSIREEGDENVYIFNASDHASSELRIKFGDYQLYNTELTYHIENFTDRSGEFEVTFPGSFLPYQEVFVENISPKPDRITTDTDGNVLGYYKLRKGEKKTVIFKGQIKIDVSSSAYIDAKLDVYAPYLLPDVYWEVYAPELTELTAGMSSVKDVYDFVTQNLHYDAVVNDDGSISRKGALAALQNKDSSVCMEYTDLTVTMLRAMGIPAREVDGYAYTDDDEALLQPTVSDVLHAWVQYYDPDKGWINIDPTWGSTTKRDYLNNFDDEHIILAVKGLSSQRPHPAGVYKDDEFATKDVNVTLSNSSQIDGITFSSWIGDFDYDNLPLWRKIWEWIVGLFG
ncbi:transglutaminase domain-containing protein [candidate division WWE3 bacterium]|uniref:Transglutaminase domain-containing protein n=1 Tax=candidate division WWE3 bacterium TaxID=2053526 RepID=A0A955LK84_UNCKA|nr:transglutaminase domain-containing protein [candidate division WWE3 bacterium]